MGGEKDNPKYKGLWKSSQISDRKARASKKNGDVIIKTIA